MKLKNALLALSATALLGSAAFAQIENFQPVTDDVVANPADGDWLMWRRTLNSWGYSPLDQITPENVNDLQLVWSRAMQAGFNEATPVVYDGVMFLPHPNGVIQALDPTNGDVIWEYRRDLPSDLSEIVGLSDITRNLALYEDKLYYSSNDGFMVAIDAATGQVAWETQVYDFRENPTRQTSGPIVANGKVFAGRSCDGSAGPEACFLTAHDAESGEELWRFYTIPRDGEFGDETWGDVPYETRGHVGSWMVPSYDPELNLVYFGTSVTSPYAKYTMGDTDDDYLFHTSTLALDGDTGELVWYFQHIRDHWDLDHPFERLLVDTAVAPDPEYVRWISPNVTPGEERKVLTGIPGKTGIIYTLDRATGEFLWASETTEQNVVVDMDLESGRYVMNEELVYTELGQEMFICPSAGGGKDWQASTYSPDTNVMYYPLQNLCMNALSYIDEPAGGDNGLDFQFVITPGEENVGTIWAISAETGEVLWIHEQRAATISTVATAGGLVFFGDVDGYFKALDQESGEVVWQTRLPASVTGYPVSYEVDGRQYVAVAVGGALIDGSYLGVTPELSPGRGSNSFFVFALPESE